MSHYLIGTIRDGQLLYVHIDTRNNLPYLTESPYKGIMFTDVHLASSMLNTMNTDYKTKDLLEGEELVIIRASFEPLDMTKSIEELQKEEINRQL